MEKNNMTISLSDSPMAGEKKKTFEKFYTNNYMHQTKRKCNTPVPSQLIS
jgi:hypothetical protein